MANHTQEHDSNTAGMHDAYAGVRVQIVPAPFLKRLFAYIVDLGIAGVATYAIALVCIMVGGGIGIGIDVFKKMGGLHLPRFLRLMDDKGVIGIMVIVLVLVGILLATMCTHVYFIWYEFKRGRTPGKRILGLSVISLDGKKLTLKQCFGRELIRYVDCGLFVIGFLSILLTQKKQRLGDLFAGTMVVYSKTQENESQFLYLKQSDYLLIQSQVEILPIDSSRREDFQKFAFGYIIRKEQVTDSDLNFWLKAADELVRSNVDFPLHPQDKLLFVAEYLRQNTIQRSTT